MVNSYIHTLLSFQKQFWVVPKRGWFLVTFTNILWIIFHIITTMKKLGGIRSDITCHWTNVLSRLVELIMGRATTGQFILHVLRISPKVITVADRHEEGLEPQSALWSCTKQMVYLDWVYLKQCSHRSGQGLPCQLKPQSLPLDTFPLGLPPPIRYLSKAVWVTSQWRQPQFETAHFILISVLCQISISFSRPLPA